MTLTPWGEVVGSRSIEPVKERGARSRDKRKQLFAAMVASCVKRGFEATTVAHLLELSKLSRATFYATFEDKHDCFNAMLNEAVEDALQAVQRRARQAPPGPARVEAALNALAEPLATYPETARVCLLDAFAAGPATRVTLDTAIGDIATVVGAAIAECDGRATMPAEITWATVAGVVKIFQNRVTHDDTDGLEELAPQLTRWLVALPSPPRSLRPPRRPPADSVVASAFALHSPAEKIMRALAETVAMRGYPEATIAEISATARISQRTFYQHFEGKEEATIAALDASGAQMLAATLPAIRRAPDWPSAVRSAYAGMCGFLAAEPAFARLRTIEAYAAGARALEMRDKAGTELLTAILGAAPEASAERAEPLLLEAIMASVYSMLYFQAADGDPHGFRRTVPLAVYITLTPFIGAEAACEAASSDGRRRGGEARRAGGG